MGSGKNLCEELATEISSIKAVLGDATVRLPDALKAYTSFVAAKPEQKYKRLHLQLKLLLRQPNLMKFCLSKLKWTIWSRTFLT